MLSLFFDLSRSPRSQGHILLRCQRSNRTSRIFTKTLTNFQRHQNFESDRKKMTSLQLYILHQFFLVNDSTKKIRDLSRQKKVHKKHNLLVLAYKPINFRELPCAKSKMLYNCANFCIVLQDFLQIREFSNFLYSESNFSILPINVNPSPITL